MITFEEPILESEERKILSEAIEKSSVAQGPFVKRFEEKAASYFGTKYCAASMNGTTALHLALAALGIGKGDEVIVPSFTFAASANVVSYCGAKPVFCDVYKDTFCIDVEDMEKKITEKTKAIIPVHVYGNVCDMDPIKKISSEHNLEIVEDAAESHGAVYKGDKAGSMSDVGCVSFHFSKIARMGEGGISLTNNKELVEKIKLLRSQGKVKVEDLRGDDFIEKRYYHPIQGFNYRMLDLQAAIGIAQIDKIDSNVAKRRKMAKIYGEQFRALDLDIMNPTKGANPSYWVYPVLFKSRKQRLSVGRELVKKSIPFTPFFWPCHKQPFFESGESIEVAENIAFRGLVFPCNPLLTQDDITEIARIIKPLLKNA